MLIRAYKIHPDDVQIAESKKKNKKPIGRCSQSFAKNAAKKDKYRSNREIQTMSFARIVSPKNAQNQPQPNRLMRDLIIL